ncbi:non-specific lipid-transfer protein 1-like isoform X5 [Citrus sinensis]|uniref:non-specific lipid-transfer protein 1-like isoform X5 n=1 Tax=Citrus sinensis TaxID=2711 RepID=UPI00227860C8|nr:non-specific lipid-transfer protein 1-like isoform X5 [Citrus sinensis]
MAAQFRKVPLTVSIATMLLLLLAPLNAATTITCEQVTIWLTPCISYGVLGGAVQPACCEGIRALNAASKTTEDRRTQCNCVKEGAARIPGLDYDRVNMLPDICRR